MTTPSEELAQGAIEPAYVTPRPLGAGRVLLSRDDILKAVDVQTEEVNVPEWGGSVLVRGLTGRERDKYEASQMTMRGNKMFPALDNIRAKLVAWCICDEDGNALFTQHDIDLLGGKSAAALDRVFEVAARLSGMSEEDVADLEKSSGSSLTGGSS